MAFPPSLPRQDSFVRPHNKVAAANVERFLRGESPQAPDLALILAENREALFSAMLQRYGADATGRPVPWNPPTRTHHKANNTYSNSNVLVGSELERMRQSLLRHLRLLQQFLHPKKPIVLLDYYDGGCFTTPMLRSMLIDLLGEEYDHFVLELRPSFQTGKAVSGEDGEFLRRFRLATEKGGIVVGGGSLKGAYDQHGVFFKTNVMPLLLKNPLNRGLMICWSYQVMAEAIAQIYGMDLSILNGDLRWGTLPVKILRIQSPLSAMYNSAFQERTAINTVVYTNGDHLVCGQSVPLGGKIIGQDPDTQKLRFIRVIASDGLTDEPCGFETDDGRFICVAFHPEAERGDHIETIQGFVHEYMTSILESVYDVSSTAIAANFDPGLIKNNQSSLIRHDIGPAFYLASLNRLARSLVRDFQILRKGS